jgi:hypothetical protein
MALEQADRQHKTTIVANPVTPMKQLLTILFTPVVLVLCLVYLSFTENDSSLLSPIAIIAFTIIAGPFALAVSYAMWKDLVTQIILTNDNIIRKPPRGKTLYLRWNDIKTITIVNRGGIQLRFTRKKQNFFSSRDNHILCPPGFLFTNTLTKEAVHFILQKSQLYKIPIQGKKEQLKEIISRPYSSPRRRGIRS